MKSLFHYFARKCIYLQNEKNKFEHEYWLTWLQSRRIKYSYTTERVCLNIVIKLKRFQRQRPHPIYVSTSDHIMVCEYQR